MIDTCQAESMFQKLYSPNILAVASSHVGEDSLSVSKNARAYLRVRLHQASMSKLRQLYNVAPEWGLQPIFKRFH